MIAGTLNGLRAIVESRNTVPGVVMMQTPVGLKARSSAASVKWQDPRTVVRSIDLIRILAHEAIASQLVAIVPNYSEHPEAAKPGGVIIYVEVEGASWEGHCDVTRVPNGMLELSDTAFMFESADVTPTDSDPNQPSVFWPMLPVNQGKPLPGFTPSTHVDITHTDRTPQGAD